MQIHKEPLATLAVALSRAGNLSRFVETGTFLGNSLQWASQNFKRVWTIEINADYQRKAMDSVGPLPNVSFLLGNSKDHITRVCNEIDGPALFWLDAHAGAGFFGSNENCPLLDELKAGVGVGPAALHPASMTPEPSSHHRRRRSTIANGRYARRGDARRPDAAAAIMSRSSAMS